VLEKDPSVIVHKKNEAVTSVSLKNFKLQKKIIVKSISSDKVDAFKQFVNSLDENANEKVK